MKAEAGRCKRCGCPCDGDDLCTYCVQDRERFMKAKEARQAKAKEGLCCRHCGCSEMPVYYTRRSLGKIKRVRQCRNCLKRVMTWESDGQA